MNTNVVITGMSGCIGKVLYSALRASWTVTGIDVKPGDGIPVDNVDISDIDALCSVFENTRSIVHLAANANFMSSWDTIEGPNITGTQNVFEAARIAGVDKVIFASSNHVTGLYEQDVPYRDLVAGTYEGGDPATIPLIDPAFPIRPDSFYGVSKACGESLGRYYAEKYGMRVFCIRIGTVNRQNRPLNARQFATLLTHNDLSGLVNACLENDTVQYEIFYGVSNNTWKFWDTANMQRCLGWSPTENAESFR